jgi:hypothetical protein
MSVGAPGPLVQGAALLRLDVYSAPARCAGSGVAAGAGAPVMSHTYGKNERIALDVPPGGYALLLTTFADAQATQPIGQGCVVADLSPGAQICFDLTLVALQDMATPSDLASPGGPPACAISGHANRALQFSIANDSYVDLGSVLAIPTDFTIEAWIYPTSPGGEQMVFAKDTGFVPQNQFRFGLNGTNVYFTMSDANTNDYGLGILTSATAVAANAWSHVAITKGGTVFTLFVNGAPAAVGTTSQPLMHTGTMSAMIGARNCCSDLVFNGIIDEVRLWNVARSPAAIACAMRGEISASDPQYGNLIDYWNLDETSGLTALDVTGANPGTLVNSPMRVQSTAF